MDILTYLGKVKTEHNLQERKVLGQRRRLSSVLCFCSQQKKDADIFGIIKYFKTVHSRTVRSWHTKSVREQQGVLYITLSISLKDWSNLHSFLMDGLTSVAAFNKGPVTFIKIL